MKKALPIIVYTLVLVLVTGMIASGATLLAVSAARVDQGDTVTISRDEYATLQKYTKISNIMTLIEGRYVMEDVDEDTLIDNAAAGMVALLGDPYSFYMSPERDGIHERKRFRQICRHRRNLYHRSYGRMDGAHAHLSQQPGERIRLAGGR